MFLLYRDLKTSLESCIKTAQEKYFQAASTIFPVYKDKGNNFLFPQQAKHQAHVQNASANSFFHAVFQTYETKEPVFLIFIFNNMAYCKAMQKIVGLCI